MNHSNPGATKPVTGGLTGRKKRLRPGHIRIYHIADVLSEVLIYAILIASPWAFGTTQPFTIWLMNALAFSLGGLLLVKGLVRWYAGYAPMKWGAGNTSQTLKSITRAVAGLTLAILAYCLIATLNARSSWNPTTNSFDYLNSIGWLPHSYNRPATWQTFWICLAFACVFWALRDWLLGLTASEEQPQRSIERGSSSASFRQPVFVPARLRRLLWILTLNGTLLGIEGVAQRLSGTNQLLWFMPTYFNKEALDQFGPYAYRANAAQYFNLLWPVALGFWWMLHRSGGFKQWRHHILLLCGIIMAACPVISTSRGGALITAGLVVLIPLILFISIIFFRPRRGVSARNAILTLALLCVFFASAAWLGLHFGWDALEPRMREFDEGYSGREQLNETARHIAHDYPLYGTGPGTFTALFQLYRTSPDDYWPAQLHNDWLETRITWGWMGSLFIALALLLVIARWFAPGGIHGGRRFVIILWLALAGCLVHARFDFPFQIYSIALLFVTLCAVLFTLSRRA